MTYFLVAGEVEVRVLRLELLYLGNSSVIGYSHGNRLLTWSSVTHTVLLFNQHMCMYSRLPTSDRELFLQIVLQNMLLLLHNIRFTKYVSYHLCKPLNSCTSGLMLNCHLAFFLKVCQTHATCTNPTEFCYPQGELT